MFTGKPYASLRHAVSHRLDVLVAVLQSNLEITIRSIPSEFVIRPACGKYGVWLTRRPLLFVAWKLRDVW